MAIGTCKVVRMRGEQSTSVLNLIQGEWETHEIYLAGGRFNPSESLSVARYSGALGRISSCHLNTSSAQSEAVP